MSLNADLIVDRRRMRRKLSFWRVTTIALIVVGIARAAVLAGVRDCTVAGGPCTSGAAVLAGNRTYPFGVRPYIARLTVSGLIRGDQYRAEQLDRLARSTLARA